jgi:hypothetical protein
MQSARASENPVRRPRRTCRGGIRFTGDVVRAVCRITAAYTSIFRRCFAGVNPL